MTPRAIGRVLSLAVLLALCLPPYLVSRLFGRGTFWVRMVLAGAAWILGLRVRLEGQPLVGNVLYAANHVSWLDIPALGGRVPARFIAKSEIAGWSVIGWLAKEGGSVFVARQKRSEAQRQADAVTTALGEGVPVVLFPEGGTGDGVRLDPFRAPLFSSATAAAVPVQPIVIDYGARQAEIAWPDGARFSEEMRRMLNRPAPVAVTLHFLPPLDAASLDRKALAARAHAAIAGALGVSRPA
ncbi:lysophospholipid acyltransferase family protein [uncultured Sphingomonas sp.]|uniref:lysophospholipid acyltransferase family protein n=1 Tax=uncultured Sphingomonas sp. TaxID=158754 RepID=UPI0025ED2540|nr:lysophospholipid acyltransferase family protein [uncultured Sphingomonas sp.]